jgi:hypothetical protein
MSVVTALRPCGDGAPPRYGPEARHHTNAAIDVGLMFLWQSNKECSPPKTRA